MQVIETKSTINNMSSTKSSDDSQERKLTIMIIVIVGVFFLCNITGYSLSETLILASIKPKYMTTDCSRSSRNIVYINMIYSSFRKTSNCSEFQKKYLAHIIEQSIFWIWNLEYLKRNFRFDFFNDSENTFWGFIEI